MNLSDEGIRLIKSFEGYHRALPDGRCVAYRCPAGVWTLGWGCTEGIREGMVWTESDAEEALRRELSQFEAGVNRLVTADINQNQYDALVSFAYNVGLGGLQRSTVLKRVNSRDFSKVPAALAMWNKGGGKVLPGLVARRQREGALFMKPMEAPQEPIMPHAVTETVPWYRRWWMKLTGVAAPTAVATEVVAPPDLSFWTGWQGFGTTLAGLGAWAWQRPLLTLIVLGIMAVAAFPKLIPEKWRPS